MSTARDVRLASRVEINGVLIAPVANHGRSTYVNWGCRCQECTDGHSRYVAAHRARRRALRTRDRFGAPTAPGGVVHGRRSTYLEWGCRCRPCTNAMREYARQRRAQGSGAAS